MKPLFDRVWEYSEENPDGFTLNIETFKTVKKGIAVAYYATQDCYGKQGLNFALNHALTNNKILGGWLNVENEHYYFDSIRIFTELIKAIQFGIENKQIAIFNITTLEEISIEG